MGLFDKFFSSVTGGVESLKNHQTSSSSCAVGLPCSQATRPLKTLLCAIFCAGTGQVQGVGFRFTNTNLAQTHALTGWVRNMEDGSVEMEVQGAPANILSHLEALHASYERMGMRFRLETPRPEPRLPMKTVSFLVISIVC